MQRLIPFGNTYFESEPFSIDEQSTIRLWLVRKDQTTSVGEAEADIQQSDSTRTQWTTIAHLNDESPYFDLEGSDDEILFRVVRRQQTPNLAVDATKPGVQSRLLQGSVLSGEWDAGACIAAKFIAGTDPTVATTTGFLFSKTVDANAFGQLLNPLPRGDWDDFGLKLDTTLGTAELIYDPPVATPGLSGMNSGTIRIHDKTGAVLATFEATASNTDISIDQTPAPVPIALTPGETYYLTICHPDEEFTFSVGSLSSTGRFTLDQNDIPARLSVDFANAGETLQLYAVEGELSDRVIGPITRDDGSALTLSSAYPVHRIEAPGMYEWRRSDNSDAAVYLNTGWAT